MDISFVLLTWNSEKYIKKCLDSLFISLFSESFSHEIFIADNGSKDATVSIIKSYQNQYPGCIRPIFLDRNTGTTYPRNLALKQANGRYIVIMDSDVEIHKGTISGLINNLDMNKNIGLAVPRLFYPNGNLQKSTDHFPTVFTKIFRYFFLKFMEKQENKTVHEISRSHALRGNALCEVDYAISALWVMKREVLERVGLLDENIFYSPEDVDYCLRIRKAGYKILYNPMVSAVHHTQEISRGFKINRAKLSHIRGLFYYFRKHGYYFRKPDFDDK